MLPVKDIEDHIYRMLACLDNYICLSNKQGYTDINVACENLILGMMNIVYDLKLENYNGKNHIANAKGIDLIDTNNMICVQVSSTHSKTKLNKTFDGVRETQALEGYHLKFFALVQNAKNLRRYNNDNDKFSFTGKNDVIDFNSFCSDLSQLEPTQLNAIDSFLSRWLGQDYYLPDPFANKMDQLNKQGGFAEPKDYYSRSINVASKDTFFIDMYLNIELYRSHTLYEYVNGDVPECKTKYWLLIAAGQTGKSCEVQNLAYQLNKTENSYPMVYEAKKFKSVDSELDIPFCFQPEHIIYILDGIDEISSEELRESFIDKVNTLKANYPSMRILMTCRRNYIDSTKFPDFQRLWLNDLSQDEVNDIVHNSDITRPEVFLQKIEDQELYRILGNPFFLKTMMKYYREHEEIQNNRLKLYRYLIDSSYYADNCKKPGQRVHQKTHGDTLLRRIALVLQLTEQKSISETELKRDMKLTDTDIELCKCFMIFLCDEKQNYSFEVNSFEMYYVTDFLNGKNSEEILNLISYSNNNVLRIRPQWYDVFELLLSSMDDNDERIPYLLEWTFKNDIEVLLNVDTQSLDPEFKDRIFTTILLNYKQKQISSSPEMGWNFYNQLAALCTTNESIKFFISEYKNEKKLGPYFYLLSFVYWFIDSYYITINNYENEFKSATFSYLYKYGEINSDLYEALYVPFQNDIFSNKEDIATLVKATNKITDTKLKILIFQLIKKAKLCDDFIDFVIENEKFIHDYRRKGHDDINSVTRDSVYYAFTHIREYKNLKKIWNYCPKLKEDYRGHDSDRKLHKLRCDMLSITEIHIAKHPDLVEDVKQAWIKECDKSSHVAYTPNSIYQDYRNFFVRNDLCLNVEGVCDQLYNIFKIDKYKHEEFMPIYARIVLVITKGELDILAAKWDANDNYRCTLMRWLKNTPLPDVNATAIQWINKKFVQAKSPYDNQPNYEQMNLDKIALVFKHPRFKETINHIINKFGPVNKKELWMNIKEDDEEKLNNYLMQYLQWYTDNQTGKYNIEKIQKSLTQRLPYYDLIVFVVWHNKEVKFSSSQMIIIEKSVKAVIISNKSSEDTIHVCLNLVLKYDIKLDSDLIIKRLPFAGVSYCVDSKADNKKYFIDYAMKKLGTDKVKQFLPKLISHPPVRNNEKHLQKVAELIVRLKLTNLYPQICELIKNNLYDKQSFAKILMTDKNKGVDILKMQFPKFNSDVQIYILEQLSQMPKQQKYTLNMVVKYRSTFSKNENKKALIILLRLGYDNALDECMEWLSKDISFLCEPFMAPSLNYIDIKYLPKMLSLLRVVWDTKEPYSNWLTRVEESLTKMAATNQKQFFEVNEGLTQLMKKDTKYKRLNYFLGNLKNIDPRLKEAKISITDAMAIIDKI